MSETDIVSLVVSASTTSCCHIIGTVGSVPLLSPLYRQSPLPISSLPLRPLLNMRNAGGLLRRPHCPSLCPFLLRHIFQHGQLSCRFAQRDAPSDHCRQRDCMQRLLASPWHPNEPGQPSGLQGRGTGHFSTLVGSFDVPHCNEAFRVNVKWSPTRMVWDHE